MSYTQQFKDLGFEAQCSDAYPLLMDNISSTPQFHIVNIVHESPSSIPSSQSETLDFNAPQTDSISAESLSRRQPTDIVTTTPTTISSASSLAGQVRDDFGPRYRASPLNSGLWISIELTITISQIFASIIVLSLSRHEKPQTPLSVWVAGYAAGCLATLPLLYWRYTLRYARGFELDAAAQPASQFHDSNGLNRRSSYLALPHPVSRDEDHDNSSRTRSLEGRVSSRDNSRVERLVENFKIALDCYFAVWFVVGNVWVFGGHSSSGEAPILYRLCIVFLTFSCIGYAMPFILCATICCCLPCIIALLGFREEHPHGRGASPEIIASLPTFKFKAKESKKLKRLKEDEESDGEYFTEGGYVAAGTEKERAISADDALCCICLGNYTDGVDLRELPCTHHFHVACVDKWLNISALCPLCKHEIGGSISQHKPAANETGN
ncbi:hypothetical protein O6H91_06G005200 [Diphasiastrum complanatum]|uniref:Uncharacterized protein n=1 Tax=Diphasiastrum complanatum TaxID=34168 RepID=A0ACC2DA59_DIPCM|nr:hypothetical protein O6H91_06G005200 [Diphasiastrum complanatum]